METKTSVQLQAQANHHNHSRQQQQQPQHHRNAMNKSSSRNSESSAYPDSPLRFHSPLRSETESPPYASPAAYLERPDNSKAIVVIDKQTQCSPSPLRPSVPKRESRNHPTAADGNAPASARKPATGGGGGEDGKSEAVTTILRRSRARDMMKKAMLWARVLEAAICMSSFAVMAADKTQGWSGDSFDRYREYRFCLTINVIGFVYSGFQAYCSAYHLITGKHVIGHHLRRHFDFSMDQILSYLLISASSAAATRVDDWETNWGKDQFTQMASASIALAFLAFLAFAFSSLLSGYGLWTRDFT
ncbi:CASP-like protein 4A3 [Punica granatum]|uniref:CASP-like protein 4A3 n=2 Tax=Punica granatum TaxID=22663 RepID=A0A6P8BYJ1_PUNGR|nr:CASP-like protein 4A3 [Punica granatum]PKI59141.1 hypothetical protein CRG98_020507 [Punica granatum]